MPGCTATIRASTAGIFLWKTASAPLVRTCRNRRQRTDRQGTFPHPRQEDPHLPYGLVDSDFTNPEYERRLSRLKVDIIAYQDEVGCVREPFPMPRLKENWKKLR
ncbi:MAG: hypothetical protein ACLUVY_05680 [Bacteroides uniformis]